MPAIAVAILVATLALAAWRDVATRTIPDLAAILVAVIGLTVRATAGWPQLFLSTAAAALLFIVLLACAIRGWIGGGDVKLAAAVALGLPITGIWDFLMCTTLAGGVLGLGYLVGQGFAPRLRPTGTARSAARILAVEARRLRRGGPLPYGVAIAVGGTFVLFAGS